LTVDILYDNHPDADSSHLQEREIQRRQAVKQAQEIHDQKVVFVLIFHTLTCLAQKDKQEYIYSIIYSIRVLYMCAKVLYLSLTPMDPDIYLILFNIIYVSSHYLCANV